ncbi:hypothetical protein [Streptomyces cadmiisoli]|uniref:hypothetical protein n=1 Tax=Streptomyces cadmiisoli TaxID=2184053 RepID=UPI0013A6D8DA|nr:hypothetical protein [Streptomyces cadmiisoli]
MDLLRSPTAPASDSYQLDLTPGQEAVDTGANTLLISDPSGTSTLITAPLARDARGNRIPVSLRLVNDEVVVALEPTAGQALAYPVLLDPSYLSERHRPRHRMVESRPIVCHDQGS